MKYIIPILLSLFVFLVPASSFGQMSPLDIKAIADCREECPTQYIQKEGNIYIQGCGAGLFIGIPQKSLLANLDSDSAFRGRSCGEIDIGSKIFYSGDIAVTTKGVYMNARKINFKSTVRDLLNKKKASFVIKIISVLLLLYVGRKGYSPFFKRNKDDMKGSLKNILYGILIGISVYFIISFFLFLISQGVKPKNYGSPS